MAVLAALGGGRAVVVSVVLTCLAAAALLVVRERRLGPSGSRARALRRFASGACALSFVALVTALGGNLAAAGRPTQAALAARFLEHRAEYERVRAMVQGDALATVGDCGASYGRKPFQDDPPERVGLSAERAASYRSALRGVDCPLVVSHPDGSVTFSMASWGVANRGWRMQLVWSKQEPKPLLPTLDGFRKSKGRWEWETAYSRLDGDWYLSIVW